MPRYTVKIPKTVSKSIKAIPLPWQNRVVKALGLLESRTDLGPKARGKYQGFHYFTILPYRVIYKLYAHQSIIQIVEVSHEGHKGN
jgi:mRNA-degrading endonuclease RelE of RelBE toxin-antitoxin system